MAITATPTDAEALSWLPLLLQTSDALFPTGAYAHSLGFEEIVRLDVVRDEKSLGDFLHEQLAPALQHQELPYLRFAFAAVALGDLDELCAIDHEISAWKLPRELRDASAQLGTRRLKALRAISEVEILVAFDRRIQGGKARGHHLVVCALQAAIIRLPLQAALATYAYQAFAGVASAALKLIRIGQDGCQRALRSAAEEIDTLVERSLAVQRRDAGWFNPLLEISSMRHERADERLFIS